MTILSMILTVVGLIVFETVSSVDNAIINAHVLHGMGQRARRWFLTWGIFFAVFVVRGILPWMIVWIAVPNLGPIGALLFAFSGDPSLTETVHQAAPVLLMGGGYFLVLLFLDWLFLEEKSFGLPGEKFFFKHGDWFYAAASVILAVIVWYTISIGKPELAISAAIGTAVYFITHCFKKSAENEEKKLETGGSGLSDIAKLCYLEAIDMSFSIDGVLGAFAFTFVVPLIIVGNGIGAVIVRQITVGNIEKIKRYRYLKNGAMYSILFLGGVMLADAFGAEIPEWFSPIVTIAVIALYFWKSLRAIKREDGSKA